ncbi:MAG: hypothetical protein AAFY88_17150, partial [Acidobacteriota bacterium]
MAALAVWFVALVFVAFGANGQSTAFTYQGEFLMDGMALDAALDMEFALFNAPSFGSQVGPTVTVNSVGLDKGLFDVELDFGAIFDGTPLWLEIRIKDAGSPDPFLTLNPRQPLTGTPGALFAQRADDADTVDGQDAFDL